MKVDVIIPAYNEEERIESTLANLQKEDWINKLIVVDDGSLDRTKGIAGKYADQVISSNQNRGKTNAVLSGLMEVTAEWVVLLDADLGDTASEGKKLLTPLV